ncbi:Hypp2836 [Branchiostoma lanceolatum]|uniref:Hypp2836 protein n=1 Tax=Branchiostoma lanceolatum TaxID=7740 RepID=A0A8K0EPQ9_BRALA|nr:Hypp2836 [Branchiostoma lanceolatum]
MAVEIFRDWLRKVDRETERRQISYCAGPVPSQRTRPLPAPRTPRHRPAEAGPTPDGNLASRTNQDQRWYFSTPVTPSPTRAISSHLSDSSAPDFPLLSGRSSFGVTSPPESTLTPITSPASSPISPVQIRQKI